LLAVQPYVGKLIENIRLLNYYEQITFRSITHCNKSRKMKLAGNVAHMGEMRRAYKILVGKPEGMRPPGRPRRRWILGEAGWECVDWMH
jgi:hypothetical protein